MMVPRRMAKVAGCASLIFRPRTSSAGVFLFNLEVAFLCVIITRWRNTFKKMISFPHAFMVCLTVWTARSASPFAFGWQIGDYILSIP